MMKMSPKMSSTKTGYVTPFGEAFTCHTTRTFPAELKNSWKATRDTLTILLRVHGGQLVLGTRKDACVKARIQRLEIKHGLVVATCEVIAGEGCFLFSPNLQNNEQLVIYEENHIMMRVWASESACLCRHKTY